VKYAWIDQHEDFYPTTVMCRVLCVSRSGYYNWLGRGESRRDKWRQEIAVAVTQSHADSHGIYGHRRVHKDVVEDHKIDCCRETVRKVMGDLGLSGKVKKRFVRTTDSNHSHPVAANVLERDFTAGRPNEKWLADITYIATREGWLYLAVVLDCFSRRIVGWSMAEHLRAELVVTALKMAVEQRCPGSGLIHHSDRGVQYASQLYQGILQAAGITVSMSRTGDPWDNAMTESFIGTLKSEWVDGPYAGQADAELELFKYIEMFYNRRRRHSSLGYVSPARYEELHELGKLPTDDQAA